MTIDDAIDTADREIEAILAHRRDELALQMIADGVDPNAVVDEPPDPGAVWTRTTFRQILADQRTIDDAWKAGALVTLRRQLEAELAAPVR